MIIIPTQLRMDLLTNTSDMRMPSGTEVVLEHVIISDKHIMATNKHIFAICELKFDVGENEKNTVIPMKCYREARAMANKEKIKSFRLELDKDKWYYVDESGKRKESWDNEKIAKESIESVVRQMYEFLKIIKYNKTAKIITYNYLGQLKSLINALGLGERHACRMEHIYWRHNGEKDAIEDLRYFPALAISGYYEKDEELKFVSAFMGSRVQTEFEEVDNYLEGELNKEETRFAREHYYKKSEVVLHSDES